MHRFTIQRVAIIAIILAIPFAAFAGPVGKARGGGSSIEWQLSVQGHDRVELRVLTPDGELITKEFKGGQTPSLRLQDLGTDVADGSYNYELRVYQKVSSDVAKKLEKARAANDDAAAKKIMKDAGLQEQGMSGGFTILNRTIVDTEQTENGASADDVASSVRSGEGRVGANVQRPTGKVAVNDTVIPDDLIVQSSLCVGFDCVDGESFGTDTIRMKENNTRIKAEDTSTSAGFASSDWQLTFNDQPSGGQNKFSVDDITGATTPLTVEGGTPSNSLYVDSTGRIGFRNSTPGLDLHVTTSNTPAIRLEQTNAGGFTAQTWDIGGNEANFFVRDLTGGSRLPFRIRPGAPTSSVDIAADGDVGIGTASPSDRLDVRCDSAGKACLKIFNSNLAGFSGFEAFDEAGTSSFFMGTDNTNNNVRINTVNNFPMVFLTNSSEHLRLDIDGDVGINCNNPTSDLVIATTTAGCSGSTSSINAGSAQFTVSSSRTLKENLEPVAVPNLLDKMSQVKVYEYDFKQGPKDRIGLMAEDFHEILGRGDDKHIDGGDVQVALWMAVQQLTEQNKALTDRLTTLEKELEETKP